MSKLKNPQERLDSVVFPLLRDDIATRSLPMANREINSLTDSVVAIRDQLQVLTRQSGFLDDSAVVVSELLDIVDPILARLNQIDSLFSSIYDLSIERAVLSGAGGMAPFANNATILPFTTATLPDDTDATIQADETLGTITVGRAGRYFISGYFIVLGSANNQDYGIRLSLNGGASVFYLNIFQNPAGGLPQVCSAGIEVVLAATDVITAEVYSTSGTLAITIASMEVKMVAFP